MRHCSTSSAAVLGRSPRRWCRCRFGPVPRARHRPHESAEGCDLRSTCRSRFRRTRQGEASPHARPRHHSLIGQNDTQRTADATLSRRHRAAARSSGKPSGTGEAKAPVQAGRSDHSVRQSSSSPNPRTERDPPKRASDLVFLGSPYGIRTRAATLRGWCPRPLDERAEWRPTTIAVPRTLATRPDPEGLDRHPWGAENDGSPTLRAGDLRAGVRGIEPLITVPETAVLPITPHPTVRWPPSPATGAAEDCSGLSR